MLKIIMLGLVLAAVALSGVMSVADAETVPSPLQQVRDGVPIDEVVCFENRVLMVSQTGMPACVFEESVLELETRGFEFIGEPFDMFPIKSSDMFPIKSSDMFPIKSSDMADSTLWTGDPPPVITMSMLPNIGETAIVEINFTNAVWGDVTDTERYRTGFFETGWKVTSKFEIVDSGGLKYETGYFYGTNEIADYSYTAFTPLNAGESKTYRIEIRAVEEGKSAVSAYGYGEEAAIVVYLDDEETMLTHVHMARYPEMHERTARTVSDNGREPKPLTDEESRALEQNVQEPTREELIEFITIYVRDEQPSIEWALDNLLLPSGPLNMTEVRQVLSDAGYTDAEIDDALSQHPFTQPSDMSGLDGDGDAAYTIPSSVADASNALALNFYRQVSGDDENIFFSPISMYTAFSVLYEGAEGDTAVQIRDAFGLEERPTARHKAVSDTMSSLNRDDPYATVEMANSLWIADRFEPYDSYINTARDTYLASVEIVDFLDKTEDGAVDRINAWASEKTHGKIPQVLLHDDVNERTVATILNAIYFKGSWVTEFPKDATHESDFWTGTDTARADFMNIVADFEYYDNDSVQILKLPYKGDRLSMLIFLPSERDGMSSFEQMITPGIIKEWKEQMFSTEVQVSIPKIEVRTHYDLKEPLGNLGVLDAFDPYTASLSGIANLTKTGNLYVDKAVHDAYLKINEEGTEAAAVTSIIVGDLSLPVREEFVADHPFLFVIQDDESDTFLFIGKILNPQK